MTKELLSTKRINKHVISLHKINTTFYQCHNTRMINGGWINIFGQTFLGYSFYSFKERQAFDIKYGQKHS